MVKLAESKKVSMLQNGNVHILLVLISEKRLNGFLAVAKINFLQVNFTGEGM
jgi:hypothetical protein